MARAAVVTALVVATALVASATDFSFNEAELSSEEAVSALYARWRVHHGVTREKAWRLKVFKEKTRLVHDFNQGDAPYKLGLNRFSDTSEEELQAGTHGNCAHRSMHFDYSH